MKVINTLFLIAVIISISSFCPCLKPASAIANVDDQAFYTKAIDAIIVNCEKKQCLHASRSSHLRHCAETAASKADFLRHHKQRLIEGMMAENLPLKQYKIERYVNARFTNYIKQNR